MQKYNTNIKDFRDNSRSRLLDMVEWLVPRVIAAGCIVLVLMYCAALEAM